MFIFFASIFTWGLTDQFSFKKDLLLIVWVVQEVAGIAFYFLRTVLKKNTNSRSIKKFKSKF